MEDVIEIHDKICPNTEEEKRIQLSLDGVQECRSNSVSLDIYSVKMNKCRNIYPLKIIRPLNKFPIDYKPHFKSVLDNVLDCNCILAQFIADNPKCAIIREALNHASKYACEYWSSRAQQYANTLHKLKEDEKIDLQIKHLEHDISIINNSASSSSSSEKKKKVTLLENLIKELKQKKLNLRSKQIQFGQNQPVMVS